MQIRRSLVALALSLSSVAVLGQAPSYQTPAAASAPTVIPSLVPYSGTATASDGKPLTGEARITLLIFKEEEGGEPLWAESQITAVDSTGHYKVQLGASNPNGLPADLFSSGEARWLEVQIAGESPQPRVLLASVPYALKAADAATLGGLPASAFDFRYQLTVLDERFAQAVVSKEIKNGQFTIHTNASNVKVSWQITAVRQDAYAKAHPLVVEQQKPASERNFYLHPELYGQSAARQADASHIYGEPASAVGKNFPVPPRPETKLPVPPAANRPGAPNLNHPTQRPATSPVAQLATK